MEKKQTAGTNLSLDQSIPVDLQTHERKSIIVVQVIELWNAFNAAITKLYSSNLRHFCSVLFWSDKVMHHSNCHAIMASFSLGSLNLEAAGTQFFPPRIFPLS